MEEALMKRVMPNSLEAEQSVIGSMIMDREAIIAASEILLKEDFYHQQYGVLFEAMVELFNEGQPADLVTLQNRLKEKDVPPEVSSLEYVRDLVAAGTKSLSPEIKMILSTCFLKESEEISTPILMSTPFWVTDNEKSFSSNSSIVFTPDNIFFITSGFMLK